MPPESPGWFVKTQPAGLHPQFRILQTWGWGDTESFHFQQIPRAADAAGPGTKFRLI